MVRVRSTLSTRRRRKRVIKKAKGQFGHRSRRYTQAKRSTDKGMAYAYRDRKVKKRLFKSVWVVRINAACQESGINYSRFMNGLTKANISINRKMMAELAVNSPSAFKKLVKIAKDSLDHKGAKSASKEKEPAAA